MFILKGLQSAGRFVKADIRGYFLAAFAVLAAAALKISGTPLAVFLILVLVWSALCIIGCFPEKDEKYESLLAKYKEENAYNETIIKQRDDATRKAETEEKRATKLSGLLFTQFCMRITERFRAAGFPDASWDFLTPEPETALADGQKVRIKLKDSGDFVYADVSFHPRSGILSLDISKPIDDIPSEPVQKIQESLQKPERKNEDEALKKWLDDHASDVEDDGFSANKKGRQSFVYTKDLPSDKSLWPRLCELLVEDEFYDSAKPTEDGIEIAIKNFQAAV